MEKNLLAQTHKGGNKDQTTAQEYVGAHALPSTASCGTELRMSKNAFEKVIRLLPVVCFPCVGFVWLWRRWFERAFEEDLVPA